MGSKGLSINWIKMYSYHIACRCGWGVEGMESQVRGWTDV